MAFEDVLIPNQTWGTDYPVNNPNPIDGTTCQPRTEIYMAEYLTTDTMYLQFKMEAGATLMCDWNFNLYGNDQLENNGLFAGALSPNFAFGGDWAFSSILNGMVHTPTVGSTALTYAISLGATANIYKVSYRLRFASSGSITPRLKDGVSTALGTAQTDDGYYTELITLGTGGITEAAFVVDDGTEVVISDWTVEYLGVNACAEPDGTWTINADGSLTHIVYDDGALGIGGIGIVVGNYYKLVIKSEATVGSATLTNGSQSFDIVSGVQEIYFYAYTDLIIIAAGAASDITITDVEIYEVTPISLWLIRKNDDTESSCDMSAYMTTYKDYCTFIIPLENIIGGEGSCDMLEGCFHWLYGYAEDALGITQNFKIVAESSECNLAVTATGDCEQLGFYFGSGFVLFQRLMVHKFAPKYPMKNETDISADGTYRRQFAEREKKYEVRIGWCDEQAMDCLSAQLLLDLQIDDIDYFFKDTSLEPEADNERISQLVRATFELYVGKSIKKTNCDECEDTSQQRCTYTAVYDLTGLEAYVWAILYHDGTSDVLGAGVIPYNDTAQLLSELQSLGLGVWTVELVGSTITITFEQYGVNTLLESILLYNPLLEATRIFVPFISLDCDGAALEARILFEGESAEVAFNDWLMNEEGSLVIVKSCTGFDFHVAHVAEWLAIDANATVEWVGYTPAVLLSDTLNQRLNCSSPDNYSVIIVADGVAHTSNIIASDFTTIQCGLCAFDVADELTISAVDNNDGTWTLSTTALGSSSGHSYTNNHKWYHITDNRGTVLNTLIASGVLTVDVSVNGVYGYTDDDIFGNIIAPFIKNL